MTYVCNGSIILKGVVEIPLKPTSQNCFQHNGKTLDAMVSSPKLCSIMLELLSTFAVV